MPEFNQNLSKSYASFGDVFLSRTWKYSVCHCLVVLLLWLHIIAAKQTDRSVVIRNCASTVCLEFAAFSCPMWTPGDAFFVKIDLICFLARMIIRGN